MNKHEPLPADAEMPAFRAYLDRIGAKQKSFRKYAVEAENDEPAYGTLRRIVATITVMDGKLECSSDDYCPDKERGDDVDAIASELARGSSSWPKSISATKAFVADLRKQIGGDPILFLFPDRKGGGFSFAQQRINDKTGDKKDLPWSFWSDGKWRLMEPDGLLPLLGLDLIDSGKPVMIHEGAKAAQYCQWLCSDDAEARAKLAAHPWGTELKYYSHIGWPGGANNAGRVDWQPIRDLPAHRRVILVCDHDQVGIDAVSEISRRLRRSMTAVIFDDNFPKAFDLADPWPELPQWRRGKRYVGPTLEDLSRPATWATEAAVKTGDKGRPQHRVRKQFANEWISVTMPSVFVHRTQTDRLLKDDTFNRNIRPFSDVDDTARLLARNLSVQVDGVTYAPGLGRGVVTIGGLRLLNTHRPSDVEATNDSCQPWLDFMTHLIPGEADRLHAMCWCATLIARPDVRMRYGILLISEAQGIGKGTLGEKILAPLVGLWNASFPSEHQLLDSGFNSWLAHKRLAVVHEIYSGHSRRGYDKLKSVITDTKVEVNRKNIEEYTLDNYIHVFACSNSIKALHIDDEDRRWFAPRVTEQKKDVEYWQGLYRWIDGGGLGAIRRWADEFVAEHGHVKEGEPPPASTMKDEIIAESRSTGAQLAYDLAKQILQQDKKVVLAVQEVRTWVKDKRGMYSDSDPKLESPLTLRKAMIAAGLKEPEPGTDGRRPRFTITITTHNGSSMQGRQTTIQSHVLANFRIDTGTQWPDLKDHFVMASSLWPL